MDYLSKIKQITAGVKPRSAWYFAVIVLAVLGSGTILTYASIAPDDFPGKKTVTIEKDMTLSEAAELLTREKIIRSPTVYKAYSVLIGKARVLAGDYLFDDPQSALRVAYRTARGLEGQPKLKITVPEGSTASDIADILSGNIPDFDAKGFLSLAKDKEGYFFPDTYFFGENVTARQAVNEMRDNFDERIDGISKEVGKFGKPLRDIIIMASIVEKEANNEKDRKIIAGILWKRISDGMPLQVDAPFYFALGKRNNERVSLDDLASDSPYNTYKHAGLPPTPISNPGLETIIDTVTPVDSDYWYYLSDKKGNMHYAETHDGHVANKARYLQ